MVSLSWTTISAVDMKSPTFATRLMWHLRSGALAYAPAEPPGGIESDCASDAAGCKRTSAWRAHA